MNIAITGANLVIKGVVCKDAAWVCLFNQIRPFSKWNMQEKIKYSSEISVFKQEWLCETFLFVLIIVHLIVKKIMKIRHILVFRFKKKSSKWPLCQKGLRQKSYGTICRYFQLVFQNFDTLFIYFRYYLTLNNLTD